jgi:glycosyltransferase involved in cell wall biosynthesis
MRIAVNCRLLLKDRLEGIGRFAHETLQRLATQHPEHQFIFIFDRPWDEQFIYSSNVIPVQVSPQARHPFLYYIWFEWQLPRIFKKYKADIFFSPDGYLSLSAQLPQIQVIHDLAFEHFPDGVSAINRWHYQHYFPKYAKKASHIIAVSAYTKKDIQDTYHIDASKITVAGNAASSGFKPLEAIKQQEVRTQYSQGLPYFLFTGAMHPRKNLGNLLLGFDYFKLQTGSAYKLLITGREGWKNENMQEIYKGMQYKDDVIFTGRVSEIELYKLVASAFAMCYISLFEGFGIPIIEAMQCGVPVITSTTSSMPEVAGNAALLAHPHSPTEIRDAMIELASNEQLRKNLIEKGISRALDFTWQKTADILWNEIIIYNQPSP